jgi:hydroxypyruvate reductase
MSNPEVDVRLSLAELFAATAAGLDGEALVASALAAGGAALAKATHVLAVGKVALPMWRGLAAAALSPARALAVVPAPLVPDAPLDELRSLQIIAGDHPQPTERSVAAARAVAAFVAGVDATSRPRLLVLLSGGSSALLCAPADGLSLTDKRAAISAVAAAGATIAQLNTVRKHLSALKGGRLALLTGAPVEVLALSDVIGDDPATIGSGPFSADPTTFADAQQVIAQLGANVPASVAGHLQAGAAGGFSETPKPGDPRLDQVRYRIIAGPDTARAEARRQAQSAGWDVGDLPANSEHSVDQLTAIVVQRAQQLLAAPAARQLFAAPAARRCVLIGNGEPTIKVSGTGRGGRATHLALLVARGLDQLLGQLPDAARGQANVAFLAAGTDDRDGSSDVSGGAVDGATWARAVAQGLDPQGALDRCDSATLLQKIGATVRGPGTSNLLDLHFLAVDHR